MGNVFIISRVSVVRPGEKLRPLNGVYTNTSIIPFLLFPITLKKCGNQEKLMRTI